MQSSRFQIQWKIKALKWIQLNYNLQYLGIKSDLGMQMSEISEQNSKTQQLAIPDIFTYEFYETHRYQISEKDGYECLCNNGFIKFYTLKTRVYWHAQNEFEHRVPDWKFHISVKHEHLKTAWNLIVALFIKMKCRAGIKTIYLKESVNPEPGRQITLYIVKYSNKFKNSSFAGDFGISMADQHSQDFWKEMVTEIQNILWSHQIASNGLASGDLKIGNYVSLRNQAFVLNEEGNYIYPRNSDGWNPLNQPHPFNIANFIQQIQRAHPEYKEPSKIQKHRPMFYFTLPIMMITAGYLLMRKVHYS